MKIVGRLVATVIAAVCLSPFARAQAQRSTTDVIVPRLVNFSGAAADERGKAIQGIVGVTFAIYKDQNGGAALWLESQNVQADAKGNYTAQLGATKPDGLPLDLFTSGEARWLGVTVNGGSEQPRILLLSVPYALKAADAETLGGLPPSAFALAAPANVGTSTPSTFQSATTLATTSNTSPQSVAPGNTPVTTAGGTVGKIPLWDATSDISNSILTQIGSGSSAKIGINTANPLFTLDVKGSELVRGLFEMATVQYATATKGSNSNPLNLESSAWNSKTGTFTLNHFQWQAEPVGNNTANPGATLNLLYGTDPNPLTETGLKLSSNGQFTFANGQAFPGTGTITGVTAGTDLLGGGTSGTVTLNLDTSKVPQLAAPNNFVGDQSVTGNVGVVGIVAVGTNTPGVALDVNSSTTGLHTPIARFGSSGAFDSNSILTYNGTGSTEIFQSGCNNCFMLGAQPGDGGMRVNFAKKIFFGDNTGQPRLALDSAGNASQPRTANGMVKAMLKLSPFNGGRIVTCFNSTLSDSAATTPPCGFTFTRADAGQYTFGLGFQVDDRILSLTGSGDNAGAAEALMACTDLDGNCLGLTNQQVEVKSMDPTGAGDDQKLYLIVY